MGSLSLRSLIVSLRGFFYGILWPLLHSPAHWHYYFVTAYTTSHFSSFSRLFTLNRIRDKATFDGGSSSSDAGRLQCMLPIAEQQSDRGNSTYWIWEPTHCSLGRSANMGDHQSVVFLKVLKPFWYTSKKQLLNLLLNVVRLIWIHVRNWLVGTQLTLWQALCSNSVPPLTMRWKLRKFTNFSPFLQSPKPFSPITCPYEHAM